MSRFFSMPAWSLYLEAYWPLTLGPQSFSDLVQPLHFLHALLKRQNAYHLFGSVASLNWTVRVPTSRFASCSKAARVKSTCLDPGAHPAHVSTTRTKTHFLGV